ncbi:Uncharacterised protein [Mycobacteroides abscessus subsp. abscessus]|nr:Uncharacterised protein [Mycobacteroides abscessus subsp. abscessus]
MPSAILASAALVTVIQTSDPASRSRCASGAVGTPKVKDTTGTGLATRYSILSAYASSCQTGSPGATSSLSAQTFSLSRYSLRSAP